VKTVIISAAMARQRFNGCEPEYIRTVCHARCCDSPSRPTGCMVTIHPSEEAKVKARGGVIEQGLLQPKPGCKGCPFKAAETYLCGLHGSPAKPFGCIASPFTLNRTGKLIVRNRYRLLPCYEDGRRLPAYIAFRASLELLFGKEQTAAIVAWFNSGGGDFPGKMADDVYAKLVDNDAIKKLAKPKKRVGFGL